MTRGYTVNLGPIGPACEFSTPDDPGYIQEAKPMKATWLVHWPGQDTLACEEHAAKLKGVGAVIGVAVAMTTYNGTDVECTNCANETKSRLCQCICGGCKAGKHCGDEMIGCNYRFSGEEAEKILPSQY